MTTYTDTHTHTDAPAKPYAWVVSVDGETVPGQFATWGFADKARRRLAAKGAPASVYGLFADARDERDYWQRPAWDMTALFNRELDGTTFASLDELADYHQYLAEAEAENGWLRAAETNDQYAWEDEQDRMRAAAWAM